METHRPRRPPLNLLIVSGDPEAIQTIRNCFPLPDYHCATINSEEGARERLSRYPFDVVICDMEVAELSGLNLLQHGLAQESGAIFLMMGAPAEYELGIAAMKMGACDFLPKPLQPSHLIGSVRDALDRRSVLQEKRLFHTLLERTLQERTDHLQRALQQVEEGQRCTLETLVVTLDAREPETHLHSLRVEAFTILLAQKCGYGRASLKDLSQGALLHDIGKIVVPDSILLKPDKLTPAEFAVMQQHTTRGYQMLSRIPHLQRAALLALCHHERVDGTGYPLGLKGAEIPVEARIFAVADAVDVITAGRAYRAPRSLAEARAELLRCSGTQFDSDVVEVFLTIFDEEWFAIRNQVTVRYESLYQSLSAMPSLQIEAF